ncbi:unnamed protein product [Fusarium venenatum]|uniref:Uncharacterized protein n=1 Tax=Fusarium venenatum TaxID=56646 RepID=A0A2L2T6D0_9HYPO|nr:uncharacterized protein FVRRES_02886 [Fusarium venenatum]CEI66374.1 unnamed protein product [Fusarium venenatum]
MAKTCISSPFPALPAGAVLVCLHFSIGHDRCFSGPLLTAISTTQWRASCSFYGLILTNSSHAQNHQMDPFRTPAYNAIADADMHIRGIFPSLSPALVSDATAVLHPASEIRDYCILFIDVVTLVLPMRLIRIFTAHKVTSLERNVLEPDGLRQDTHGM